MIRSVLRLLPGAAMLLALTPCTPPAMAEESPRPGASAQGIAWRAFDREALESARAEGKLVMLWIHAPWGHWDRVMAETTFMDPRVVQTVREKFIPVKVDTLLRPDLFLRYGMGGWPTTAFVLPSGQPFFFPDASRKVVRAGGTFYAPDSLAEYLTELAAYHAANKEAAEKSAEEITRGIMHQKEVKDAPLKREMLDAAATLVMDAYAGLPPDPSIRKARHPDVDALALGLYYHMVRGKGREVLEVSLRMATEMARGGIRDQVGGGFHRFAADLAWRVPAFEKLLLTNAEMMQAYTDISKLTGNALFLKVAEGIAEYVQETLADPAGWFYAYQAADARLGEDGDYYTWTLEEATRALGDAERAVTLAAFDIGEWGEMVDSAPRRNVLFVNEGPRLLSERLGISEEEASRLMDAGRAKLSEARRLRTAPPVGKILVVEANAAMAAALLALGDARNVAGLREAGLKAIQFALDKALHGESGLMDRAWSPDSGRSGHADIFGDQVQMVRALLAAHESTGEARWLDAARRLAESASKAFADSVEGGWMDRIYSSDAPGLLSWPMRSMRDNAQFAEALVRLHHLIGEPADGPLMKSARTALESWGDDFVRYREGAAPFALAADRLLTGPLEVVLAGDAKDEGFQALEIKARALFHPWKVMRRTAAADAAARLRAGGKDAQAPPSEGAFALLCQAGRCAGPFTREDNLREKLAAFLKIDGAAPAAGEPPAAAP